MAYLNPVSPQVFEALQQVDIQSLTECSAYDLRPFLPTLVRIGLIKPMESSRECHEARRGLLQKLTAIEHVNAIVALLSIDFQALEADVRKEQQLRHKMGSLYEGPSQSGLANEFERSASIRRIRIVISEYYNILYQIEHNKDAVTKTSELFDNDVFLTEICDVLCIALAELPAVMSITEVVEAFLRLKYGPDIICCLLANNPHHFRMVCASLISNGERQEEDSVIGKIRGKTLRMLCKINPPQSLLVRGKCVEMCRMPGR